MISQKYKSNYQDGFLLLPELGERWKFPTSWANVLPAGKSILTPSPHIVDWHGWTKGGEVWLDSGERGGARGGFTQRRTSDGEKAFLPFSLPLLDTSCVFSLLLCVVHLSSSPAHVSVHTEKCGRFHGAKDVWNYNLISKNDILYLLISEESKAILKIIWRLDETHAVREEKGGREDWQSFEIRGRGREGGRGRGRREDGRRKPPLRLFLPGQFWSNFAAVFLADPHQRFLFESFHNTVQGRNNLLEYRSYFPPALFTIYDSSSSYNKTCPFLIANLVLPIFSSC